MDRELRQRDLTNPLGQLAVELQIRQRCAVEPRADEARVGHVGAVERRVRQIGLEKVGAAQVAAAQVCVCACTQRKNVSERAGGSAGAARGARTRSSQIAVAKIRVAEEAAPQIRLTQLRAAENRVARVRLAQHAFIHAAAGEAAAPNIRLHELRLLEVRLLEVCVRQKGAVEARVR